MINTYNLNHYFLLEKFIFDPLYFYVYIFEELTLNLLKSGTEKSWKYLMCFGVIALFVIPTLFLFVYVSN